MSEEVITVEAAAAAVESVVDDFGRARSHEASKIAYDLCKTTAQSCLLINGGAATAVLALLAKEHVDATLLRYVPFALGGYALGVALSAVMMFCIMMMADNWNYFWYNWSYIDDEAEANKNEKSANKWHWGFYGLFAIVIVLFLSTSVFVAFAVTGAKPVNNSVDQTQRLNQDLKQGR